MKQKCLTTVKKIDKNIGFTYASKGQSGQAPFGREPRQDEIFTSCIEGGLVLVVSHGHKATDDRGRR